MQTTNKQQRAKVTSDATGRVTVVRFDAYGERTSHVYFMSGSYVRQWSIYGQHPQVCKSLYNTGHALTATRETLLPVIRRELRRLRYETQRISRRDSLR